MLRKPGVKGLGLIALLCLVSTCTLASTIHTGKCVGVTDGDSIFVMIDGKEEEIRLEGIDCPEYRQAFSKRARQFTSSLVFGKQVKVREVTRDNYGRMIGRIYVGETDVSLELIRAGLAWHYKKYSKETQLSDAEVVARRNRTGLWTDPNPVPPWSFRRQAKQEPTKADSAGPFHGNIKSKVFHCSSCQHYNCKNCVVIFNTREGAEKAGFHPCGNCKP